jgi:crossover junction endodeoxyribonuclease RuvC
VTRILGIDPGLRHCGWAVLESEGSSLRYVDSGAIHPSTTAQMAERLKNLHDGLQQVALRYQPDEVALEESFVSINGQSTLKLGQARGAILLTLALAGFSVAEYAPRLIKKSVTGSGSADKTQIQTMLKLLLPQAQTASADAADALALAICHAHHRIMRRG